MPKARDPVCGMDVDTETAISRKIGDRTYYFCSQSCADVYTQPERELKAYETQSCHHAVRSRCGSELANRLHLRLAGGIMLLNLIGELKVYSLVVFLVSTPVVWVAGFSIIKGAYLSLKNLKL